MEKLRPEKVSLSVPHSSMVEQRLASDGLTWNLCTFHDPLNLCTQGTAKPPGKICRVRDSTWENYSVRTRAQKIIWNYSSSNKMSVSGGTWQETQDTNAVLRKVVFRLESVLFKGVNLDLGVLHINLVLGQLVTRQGATAESATAPVCRQERAPRILSSVWWLTPFRKIKLSRKLASSLSLVYSGFLSPLGVGWPTDTGRERWEL